MTDLDNNDGSQDKEKLKFEFVETGNEGSDEQGTRKEADPAEECPFFEKESCPANGMEDKEEIVKAAKGCSNAEKYSCPYLVEAEKPSTEEGSSDDAEKEKLRKENADLKSRLEKVETTLRDQEIKARASGLVKDGHIFPKQEGDIFKMMQSMPDNGLGLEAMLHKQKISPVGEEKGQQPTSPPGESVSDEDKARIAEEQGLNDLKRERAVNKAGA